MLTGSRQKGDLITDFIVSSSQIFFLTRRLLSSAKFIFKDDPLSCFSNFPLHLSLFLLLMPKNICHNDNFLIMNLII